MNLRKILFTLALTTTAAFGSPDVRAGTNVFFVATNGNDQWSGKIPSAGSKGGEGPFATLGRALQAVRENREGAEGSTIFVEAGTYRLTSPLTFGPEHSGRDKAHPTLVTAYNGQRAVLSGGVRIDGWRRIPGKTDWWQAPVPEVREGKWCFRDLYVNGQRRVRARTPNEGYFHIQGKSPQDKPLKLHYREGDIKPEWASDGDVEVVAYLAWADIRMQIRAVDAASRVATLSGEPRPSNQENDAQYYIENSPDALDKAGEWYLDRKNGLVTYIAMPGEDMTKAEAVAPKLEGLVVFDGDPGVGKLVHDVVLRGLTFAETNWPLGPNGYADTQAAISVQGDLRAVGAVDCAIEDCTFARLAGYAVELGRGCKRWKIVGNRMFDLGAGGLRIGETGGGESETGACGNHVITDNEIHHGGVIYPPAVGVMVLQSGGNRIAHNHIHHLYYTAVSVGWTWGYSESPCKGNIIEFNHMHDLGQSLLSDMGAVYTLGPQEGTVVRNNLIHDVNAYTYGGWGLYTDEGSTHILLENNVVYGCKSAGFHQHYGKENTIRNNIFALNKEHQLMRTRAEDHTSFFFTNNIVYFDSGDLLGSNWSNDHYTIDRNVYFDIRLGATNAAGMKFSGATVEEWRKRGHDLESLFVDPMFVDAKKRKFALQPGSPALALGFKPIDLSRVGVRPRNARD